MSRRRPPVIPCDVPPPPPTLPSAVEVDPPTFRTGPPVAVVDAGPPPPIPRLFGRRRSVLASSAPVVPCGDPVDVSQRELFRARVLAAADPLAAVSCSARVRAEAYRAAALQISAVKVAS